MEMIEIIMLSTCAGRKQFRLRRYSPHTHTHTRVRKHSIAQPSYMFQGEASPIGLVTIVPMQSHSRGGHHQGCEVWKCTHGHHCTLKGQSEF